MGLFEIDNAKIYFLGSGVVPQTRISLHTMGRKTCFWIPGMGAFAMDKASQS